MKMTDLTAFSIRKDFTGMKPLDRSCYWSKEYRVLIHVFNGASRICSCKKCNLSLGEDQARWDGRIG
jgi:hypothetical protein